MLLATSPQRQPTQSSASCSLLRLDYLSMLRRQQFPRSAYHLLSMTLHALLGKVLLITLSPMGPPKSTPGHPLHSFSAGVTNRPSIYHRLYNGQASSASQLTGAPQQTNPPWSPVHRCSSNGKAPADLTGQLQINLTPHSPFSFDTNTLLFIRLLLNLPINVVAQHPASQGTCQH